MRGARSGVPFFSSGRLAPRERNATDVVTLAGTVVSILLLSLVAVPQSGFEKAVIGLIEAVPSWLDILWWLGIITLVLWILTVLVTTLLRRRSDVALDAGLSCVAALGLGAVVGQRINGSWPSLAQIVAGGTNGTVPLVMLAIGSAFAAAVAPHVARPFRRFGQWTVATAGVSVVMLEATTPIGTLISLLLGTAAAALVHVALGTTTGRQTTVEVTSALADLGVTASNIELAPRQSGGVVALDALDEHGDALRVKVYGRDARDAQLLARAWRGLWYRGSTGTPAGRLQQVEHEAFVTLFASARGLLVPEVVVAGSDARQDSVIVVRDVSSALVDRSTDELPDAAALAGIWGVVRGMHRLGLTHGELSPEVFGVVAGRVSLREMSRVALADSDDQQQKDLAQALVSTALLVGNDRAVSVAGDELGPDGVAAMLPYLQQVALGTALRHRVKSEAFDLAALRSAIAAAVEVDVPKVAELRRVRPQSLMTMALIVFVAYALISAFGNVDVSQLVDEISGASIGWLVAALIAAQLPFLAQAVATRGACPQAVPLGPLALLQSGIGFVALAVPSTAGRIALDIRFFQRQGLQATTAVSISAIDGFSGFLVQVSVLVLTLAVGVGDVELQFKRSGSDGSGGGSNLGIALGVLAAVVVVAAIAAMALPKIRARVVERVRPILGQVADTVRSLRSPKKLLQLFGGNLATQLLFAVALGLCLRAFGGSLNLATLLTVYVASALFGGMMPVPGGVGVMEAALTAGLVAAGIGSTTSAATALVFRLVTFYLPPLWGWLSLRWLRHHDYL